MSLGMMCMGRDWLVEVAGWGTLACPPDLGIDEAAEWRFVGDRPAEIHLDLDCLAVAKRHDLRIAEAPAVFVLAFIGYDHAVAIGDEIDEVEAFDTLAVRPTALEIGRSVDAVVERTAEVEIVGEDRLDRRTVLVGIGFVHCARDSDCIPGHRPLLISSWTNGAL